MSKHTLAELKAAIPFEDILLNKIDVFDVFDQDLQNWAVGYARTCLMGNKILKADEDKMLANVFLIGLHLGIRMQENRDAGKEGQTVFKIMMSGEEQ